MDKSQPGVNINMFNKHGAGTVDYGSGLSGGCGGMEEEGDAGREVVVVGTVALRQGPAHREVIWIA